jgi:hypothetical protein
MTFQPHVQSRGKQAVTHEMFVNNHFDSSASNLNNILKFSASRIIIYFLPKAFIGTVYPVYTGVGI